MERSKPKNTATLLKLKVDYYGLYLILKVEDSLIAEHRAIPVHSREYSFVSGYFKVTKRGEKLSRPSCTEAVELLKKKQQKDFCVSLRTIMTSTSQQQGSARPGKSPRMSDWATFPSTVFRQPNFVANHSFDLLLI